MDAATNENAVNPDLTPDETPESVPTETSPEVDTPQIGAEMSDREKFEKEWAAAVTGVDDLAETMTQRDWLRITAALDRTRQQITTDTGLRLLAVGFIREDREHGAASWEKLLNFTDRQLLDLHGFPPEL